MADININVNNNTQMNIQPTNQIDKWISKHIKILDENKFLVKTNSFGQVLFKGATRRAIAKFARLDVNTNPADIFKLLVDVWQLEQPRLLISVTGGAKSFTLAPALKYQFTDGLLKVAKTPGAWVITGGTNTGVMKHVGEALHGSSKACIGIATWGIVTNAKKLINLDNTQTYSSKLYSANTEYQVACSLVQPGAFLDHNHTHHLLVDDGSVGRFGVEIPLRSRLEEYIMKTGVPSVLMVVEGGPGSLSTVREAISKSPALSVLIIVDSGRAADLLAYAYSLNNLSCIFNEKNINELLLEKIPEYLPELNTKEKQVSAYKEVLECMSKKEFITLFRMSEKRGVDEAILKALLKGNQGKGNELSLYSQLKLTLLWDRADLAKECISLRSQVVVKEEEKDLNSAMIMALAMNRVEFVKLFLSYGISIQSLLTPKVLEFLYGYHCNNSHSIIQYVLKKVEYEPASGDFKDVMELLCSYEKYNSKSILLPLNKIKSVINEACSIFKKSKSDQFIEGKSTDPEFHFPYKELFFFAVLSNMHEMALYLWRFEEDSLEKAFFGMQINNYLVGVAQKNDLPGDIAQGLKQNALEFQTLCTDLLDECYRTDRTKTEQLITCDSKQFNSHTCLSLAYLSDHKDFISHKAVQTLMNDFWTGDIKNTDISRWQFLIAFLFPPYIAFFSFYHKSDYTIIDVSDNDLTLESAELQDLKDKEVCETDMTTENLNYRLVSDSQSVNDFSAINASAKKVEKVKYLSKIMKFYFYTPVIKFLSNLIGYLLFLCLFSYVAMVKKEDKPSIAEWFLVVYIVSLAIEELRQIVQDEALTLEGKIASWWSSNWNKLDAVALSLFFVALALRFSPNTIDAAHVLYAINGGMWVFRLLNVFYIDEVLGPYVVMIFKMFIDMCSFLLILFVFLVAYGVSSAAILTPQTGGPKMIIDAMFHPYFNIYGELFIDRDPSDSNTTRFGTEFHNKYAEPLAWVLLGFYLLIANVLLLNLLIAIFNNTYEEVQANAEQIGKFERYSLILEYATRPPLIPPFILLCHFYMLVNFFKDLYLGKTSLQEKNLKRILTDRELDEVIEFENECKSQLIRKYEAKKKTNRDEKIDIFHSLMTKMDELINKK
ncbi:transient receptor potential cation channel subfamily M member 1 isoform X1 [Hydra vulgaris]|uniref:transient receptor potential cation channel subfamily M member 1 isoform X1 n=1 Tax=Hydra vulgaris TaxID=6087 RepID=UPI001F5F1257|nr:transient receptor potential cation channel subfamily M member 1 [Hydra vulgaris]